MPKTRRDDWVDCGLGILTEYDVSRLTVEHLCQSMRRTKGAFYHHFSDHRGLLAAVLETWEERYTTNIIASVSALGDDSFGRLIALDQEAVAVDNRLERNIRVWAHRDPDAREVLERVDRRRLDYLELLFGATPIMAEQARELSQLSLALMVGAQMLFPDMDESAKATLAQILHQSFAALAIHRGAEPEPEPEPEPDPEPEKE